MKAYMSTDMPRVGRLVGHEVWVARAGSETRAILQEVEPQVTDGIKNEYGGTSLLVGYGGDWQGTPGRRVGAATIGAEYAVVLAEALAGFVQD